jgi:hypothetical protein
VSRIGHTKTYLIKKKQFQGYIKLSIIYYVLHARAQTNIGNELERFLHKMIFELLYPLPLLFCKPEFEPISSKSQIVYYVKMIYDLAYKLPLLSCMQEFEPISSQKAR